MKKWVSKLIALEGVGRNGSRARVSGRFCCFVFLARGVFPPINGCELNLMIIINDATDGQNGGIKNGN